MNPVRNRLIFVCLLTVWSAWLVTPTLTYFSLPKEERNKAGVLKTILPSWLPEKHIKLGLDLQGGVQLVLGVDTKVAIDNKLSRIGTELTRWANDGPKKQVKTAYVLKGEQTLRVELEPGIDAGDFKVEFAQEFTGLTEVNRDDRKLDFIYSESQLKSIRQAALSQAERVVRNRVDKWGVTEPAISRRVDGTILVQLPGFSDPAKARELLGRTAQLKFMLLNEESKAFDSLLGDLPEGVTQARRGNFNAISFTSESKQQLLDLVKGKIPEGSEVLFEEELIAGGKKTRYTTHLLFSATEISGEDVLDAGVTYDSSSLDNRPAVSLKFTGPGGKRFSDITGENVQKRMAIVLDNTVISDPVIQVRISSGNAQITLGTGGGYNQQIEEANQLSLVLKSGALPAPITIHEERQVGATLGPELANKGVRSVLLGLCLVLVFMLAYYRRPGMISCLALTLNALFLLSLMAGFGFALTLPGFAGFILTLGMAVDANVLINERIRQELREGKSAVKAVVNGFQKVFWTIIDANVTTLIAALVLLETNSAGPIKGFAVALILGLLVSMFTSLFCTRLFFDLAVRGEKTEGNLKTWLGGHTSREWKFNFLKSGKAVSIGGVVLALVVLGMGYAKGVNWSVDFAGGTELEVVFNKEVAPAAIYGALKKAGVANSALQAVGSEGENRYLVRFGGDQKNPVAGNKATKSVRQVLLAELAPYGPDVQRVDFVGPLIGRELRTQGAMSIIYAIIGILVYIGLRFDMRFGPGAVYKMVQDVFIILGFYIFFQRSFDLTSIAALLTVVGYSVNDTIVIYDRIRENLALNPRRSLYDNINFSINETLTRTINTSVTTLLALTGILIFTSAQIWNFAMAMAIGVLSATTSSTFIASSFLLWMENWRKARRGKASAA